MAFQLNNNANSFITVDANPFSNGYPFTYGGWYYVMPGETSSYDNYCVILNKDVSDRNYGIRIDADDGKVYYAPRGTTFAESGTNNTFIDGQWLHVMARSVDEDTHNIVLNGDWANRGTVVVTSTYSGINRLTFGRLGRDVGGDGNYAAGRIGPSYGYSAALDPVDIFRLSMGADPRDIQRGDLEYYYKFDRPGNNPNLARPKFDHLAVLESDVQFLRDSVIRSKRLPYIIDIAQPVDDEPVIPPTPSQVAYMYGYMVA